MNKPSDKQLSLLKRLSLETGTSFTYPSTKQLASKEIARLMAVKRRDPHASIQPSIARLERTAIRRDCSNAAGNYAGIRDDEVAGYGSSAHWV